MQTVQTIEGHEAKVVDEGDLLAAERVMKWWLVGIVGSILIAGLMVGISYATITEQTSANTRRIEEVRVEGSLPVQALKTDIAIIRAQQAENSRILEKIEARLDNARVTPKGEK